VCANEREREDGAMILRIRGHGGALGGDGSMNGAAQIKSLTERGADVLFASKYCEEVERLRCFDSEDTRQEIERCIFAHERAQYLARLARGNSHWKQAQQDGTEPLNIIQTVLQQEDLCMTSRSSVAGGRSRQEKTQRRRRRRRRRRTRIPRAGIGVVDGGGDVVIHNYIGVVCRSLC